MSAFCSTSRIVVPCSLISSMISKIRSTKIGARPIDGSSSSSSFGRAISARPIASICCSPPDSVPAFWLLRSASRGKRSKTRSRSSSMLGLVVALERAHLEVLEHGHAPEDRRPSGDCEMPMRDDLVRARACVMSSPVGSGSARARLVEPVDRAQRRRLAGAVRADQRHDLALAHLERDALQRLDRRRSRCGRRRSSRMRRPAAARHAARRLPCRGRPRSRAGPAGPRRACPRRSSRRSRAPSMRSEMPMTTLHVVLDQQHRQRLLVAQPRDEVRELAPSPAGSCRRSARRAAAASGSVASARATSSRRWSPYGRFFA